MNPEALFWMTRYFELLGHTSKVMAQFAQPMLRASVQEQATQVAEMLKDTAPKANP